MPFCHMEYDDHSNKDAFNVDESNCSMLPNTFAYKNIASGDNVNINSIKVYIYQPFIRIRHIKLNRLSSVSILSRIYPADSIFIFNGQILDYMKSFHFYNIKNNNKIVSITQSMLKKDPVLIEKWIQITNDQDGFEERVNLNINKNSRKELARIKDIKLIRQELKRGTFIKSVKSHNLKQDTDSNNGNSLQNEMKLNADYIPIDSPSLEPLPIIW